MGLRSLTEITNRLVFYSSVLKSAIFKADGKNILASPP